MVPISRNALLRSLPHCVAVLAALEMAGCAGTTPSSTANSGAPAETVAIAIVSLHPGEAVAGEKFNVQSNGSSALAVRCKNATKDTRILFGGQELPTSFGGTELLSAEVPVQLTAKEGPQQVVLRAPTGESKPAVFMLVRR